MSKNELHAIGVTEEFRDKVEGVDPRFLQEGILRARNKTWKIFHEIRSQIKEGLTEVEARRLALQIFSDHGLQKHWHQPSIRFGTGTSLTFHNPLRADYKLQAHDPVFMDLGPVVFDEETQIEYEGDVGDSFVFGNNEVAEKCVQTVRELFLRGKKKWLEDNATGSEIYSDLKQKAVELGYTLLEDVVGHRLGDFPHHKYSRERLPNIHFYPTGHLWILELQIVDPQLEIGAFYEDLLI